MTGKVARGTPHADVYRGIHTLRVADGAILSGIVHISSADMGPRGASVTYAQAAALLDCHVSSIPKYIRRGLLTSRGGRGTKGGSLDRREVEALAAWRQEQAAARELRREEKLADPRPDGEHDWLTVAEAAEVIGLTPDAIRKRAGKGKLPHTVHCGKVWVRREHAELAANVRVVHARGLDPCAPA